LLYIGILFITQHRIKTPEKASVSYPNQKN